MSDISIIRQETEAVVVLVPAVVASDEDYARSAEFLKAIKSQAKAVTNWFQPMVDESKKALDAAKSSHKQVCGQRDEILGKLEAKEIEFKGLLNSYLDERERRLTLEAAALREKKETAALAAAATLESAGMQNEAEAVIEAAESGFPDLAVGAGPKVEGISNKKLPKWKVVDESKIGRRYFKLDETKIGKDVRTHGKEAEEIVGGISVYYERSMAVEV